MEKIAEYRKLNAPESTVTRNVTELSQPTGNIYETAVILARRADQISVELKNELSSKLETYACSASDLLAPGGVQVKPVEVFENSDLTRISQQYESIPKPSLLAMQEYLEDKIEFAEKPGEPMKRV